MPLMMDQDLDALFGDPEDVPPIHIPQSLPKDLLQHVDELRSTGCCQRIAWSKLGCIAYVSDSDRGVSTRHLFCNPENGRWDLSKPVPVGRVSAIHNECPLVHLSWNHRGSDLAIFDAVGRISILTALPTALGEFVPPEQCVVNVEDQLSAVVGLLWLNAENLFLFHESAHKEESGHWSFTNSSQKPLGPHNPSSGMSALINITKNGKIRLLVQGTDRGWQEAKTELDIHSVPAELLTHATITAHRDSTILVATHTIDHQLALYRVSIDFQRLSFNIQHLKKISDCFPIGVDTGGLAGSGSFPNAQLSHLEYFPQGPENRHGEPSRPFVLGSFADVSEQYQNDGNNSPFSVVCRWELHGDKPRVHPNFENLGSKSHKSSKTELPMDVTVKRLPDTFIPKIFLSVQQMRFSTFLAIAFSDGSVEFRDRITMDLIARDNVRTQVSGLGQIGFDFLQNEPLLHVAHSPNICAIAYLQDDKEVSLGLLQMPVAETFDDTLLEAIAEAFVLHFSSACTSWGNYQADLLAVMQLFSDHHPESKVDQKFLMELYRALDIRLDHAIEAQPDWLFRNGMIQRCLGTQLSLGYHGKQLPRSLPAKIAQGFLDIRSATLITTYNLKKSPNQQAPTDAERAEELRAVIGQVSWFTSFMAFVVNELFRLSPADNNNSNNNNNPITQPMIQSKVHTLSTPALSLLLISASRLFLKYNCRNLRQYALEANHFRGYPGPLRDTYQTLISILRDSPVQLLQFERMIMEVEAKIKEAYQGSVSDTERKTIEKEMLVSGSIPQVLMPAVTSLLTNIVDSLREEIDVAELYFSDFAWLDLASGDDDDDDNNHNQQSSKTPHQHRRRNETTPQTDSIRKTRLKPDLKVKRCIRCCALVGENPQPHGGTRNQALAQLLRTCLCGDWWMDPGKEGGGV